MKFIINIENLFDKDDLELMWRESFNSYIDKNGQKQIEENGQKFSEWFDINQMISYL